MFVTFFTFFNVFFIFGRTFFIYAYTGDFVEMLSLYFLWHMEPFQAYCIMVLQMEQHVTIVCYIL